MLLKFMQYGNRRSYSQPEKYIYDQAWRRIEYMNRGRFLYLDNAINPPSQKKSPQPDQYALLVPGSQSCDIPKGQFYREVVNHPVPFQF